MRNRRHALVAYPRDKAALSSTSSSDPGLDAFWVRYFTGTAVRLVRICAAGLAVCAVLFFLAPHNRIAETTTHFVTWYAAFGLIGTVVALAIRQWKVAALCAAFTLFYFVLIAMWYFPRPLLPAGNARNLRVVTANLLSTNGQTELFKAFVEADNPDLIFVQELSPLWARALEPLEETYPHQAVRARSDHFGIGLYSRLPLENVEIFDLAGERFPAIRADLYLNDRFVTLLNMHTVPPLTDEMFELRNLQLVAAAEFAREQDDLVIVAGDLNVTMWSPYYRELESVSALRNTRRGFGIIPTWPANLPLLQLALDHMLVSPDILTVDIRRGPNMGSDHLPLVTDVWVSAPGTPEY